MVTGTFGRPNRILTVSSLGFCNHGIKAAACFALFVVLSPTVYEQYLLWALPFLIVVALLGRRRLALVVLVDNPVNSRSKGGAGCKL